jgi:hypothetical protein
VLGLALAGGGLGSLALAALTGRSSRGNDPDSPVANPLAAQQPHFAPRAKRVVWLFMDGGPSHIDLFDYKPELAKYSGQPLPPSFKRPVTAMGVTSGTPLMASPWKFARHGQCGQWVSELYPEVATVVDELCLLQSCTADGLNFSLRLQPFRQRNLIDHLPDFRQFEHRTIDLPMRRAVEVLFDQQFHRLGHRAIVEENCAENRLLGLHILRGQFGLRQIGGRHRFHDRSLTCRRDR